MKDMKSELHLLIIWENSRHKSEWILEELKEKFTIREIFEVKWHDKDFTKNLKRFYGVTLPNPGKKMIQCGKGPFLVILITDQHPKYEKRNTSLGKQNVNVNVYDIKRKFRTMIDGEYPIHGSIHEKEANHDLILLFGKNIHDLEKTISKEWDGEIKKNTGDFFGSKKWNCLEDIFYILNSTTNYVVLRNFEELPTKKPQGDHKDIDILTDEQWHIPFLLNTTRSEKGGSPYVKIDGEKIFLDIRYVGDIYYDENWSNSILKNRIRTNKGIYIPNEKDQFYSLLYHCLIHGAGLSNDYLQKIQTLSKKLEIEIDDFSNLSKLEKILEEFMNKSGYQYTNSIKYRIKHCELVRLVNVAIFVAKHEGLNKLFYAMKGKIRRKLISPR